jgi:hypothetical protein
MSPSLIALANGTVNSVVAPRLCGIDVSAGTRAARACRVGSPRAAGSRRLDGCFDAALDGAVAFVCIPH